MGSTTLRSRLGVWWFLALLFFGLLTLAVHPKNPHFVDEYVRDSVQVFSPLRALKNEVKDVFTSLQVAEGEFIALWKHGDYIGVWFQILSAFGNWPWFGGTALCLIFYYFTRDRRGALVLFFIGLVGGLSHFPIKLYVSRARPTAETALLLTFPPGYSFPSGHATFYFVVFGFVYSYAWNVMKRGFQRHAVLCWALSNIIGVGLARIYLGAHYLTDICGGFLWGFLWLRATNAYWYPEWWNPRHHHHHQHHNAHKTVKSQ